jgi:carboxymethylenebutenolidase
VALQLGVNCLQLTHIREKVMMVDDAGLEGVGAAGVPFYGGAPAVEDVPKIKAALVLNFTANDEWVTANWPAYEAALKANGTKYEAHVYPGTRHGFHNDTTPRYAESAAKLPWQRTLDHFNKTLKS